VLYCRYYTEHFLLLLVLKRRWSKSMPKFYHDRRSSATLSWCQVTIWGPMTRFLFPSDYCGFVNVGRSLWREDESLVYSCNWKSPAQSFSGPSPAGFITIYCLKFETPPTWRARFPYLFPTETGSASYTSRNSKSKSMLSYNRQLKFKVYFTTDGQSTSSFWCRVPLWGSWPDLKFSLIWQFFPC
jgi:hypothetical protein